jgi:DNA polymerase III alpha subunit (gram-positive type)
MIKSNYLIHDCETGGLDPDKNPITQYACVILDYHTLKEVDRWETYIKPYKDLSIEKEALQHTMVNMSDINHGINLNEFVHTASDFWNSHMANAKTREKGRLVIVGHNVIFDDNFLEKAFNFEEKTIRDFLQPNLIDTMLLAKMEWGLTGEEKINLGECCKKANIRITDAHGAMNDVEATAELFKYFVRKLRSKKNEKQSSENVKRAIGSKFFEFKCKD